MSLQKYKIMENSIIEFHRLLIRKEDNEFLIGREDISVYIAIPKVGVDAIQLLKKGMAIKEAKEIIEGKYNTDIDLLSFVNKLLYYNFIRKIDDEVIQSKIQPKNAMLRNIKKKHVSWLFSKPALIVYSISIFLLFYSMLMMPTYIPKPMDLFFHDSISIVVLTTFFVGWLISIKHELAHLFAAKSVGIEGRFGIGHRLHFVVLETDVTNLWSIPRKKRYIVYIAGIISDLFLAAILTLLLILNDIQIIILPTLLYLFFKMIILGEFMSVLWQFRFYMKTDIYYVVANILKCKNLLDDSIAYIKLKLSKFFKKVSTQEFHEIPKEEMNIVRLYSLFFIIGTLVTLIMALVYAIPIFSEIIFRIFENIFRGINRYDPIYFIDGLVTLIFSSFNFILLIFVLIRKRKNKQLLAI
jgi:hypothetical protein